MGSIDPQKTFNTLLANNPEAKNAMDMINQYGNGDPQAAFRNYAISKGQEAAGQQVMKLFGLQ